MREFFGESGYPCYQFSPKPDDGVGVFYSLDNEYINGFKFYPYSVSEEFGDLDTLPMKKLRWLHNHRKVQK